MSMWEQIIVISKRMNNKTIIKRLGFMIDVKFDEIPEVFTDIKEKISSGYSNFDPIVNGKLIVEKWKLKVPVSWKKEYDRKK